MGAMCGALGTPRDIFTFSYRLQTKSGKKDFFFFLRQQATITKESL